MNSKISLKYKEKLNLYLLKYLLITKEKLVSLQWKNFREGQCHE